MDIFSGNEPSGFNCSHLGLNFLRKLENLPTSVCLPEGNYPYLTVIDLLAFNSVHYLAFDHQDFGPPKLQVLPGPVHPGLPYLSHERPNSV